MLVRIKRTVMFSTLAAVFIVLASVIAILNISNYRNITREADAILNILALNSGKFPDKENFPADMPDVYTSEELPFETRYFYVRLGYMGHIVNYDLSNVAAVDRDMATAMTTSALSLNKPYGFVNNYRYEKVYDSTGIMIMLIFIDCGKSLSMFRSSLYSSITYSLLGFLLVIALSWFLSRQAVKVYDITEKKQKQFITDAGHEIKTPIAVINADIQVLEMEHGENEWCNDIKVQTARLLSLTQSLITLSKAEAVTATSAQETFDLSAVAGECASAFTAVAKTKEKDYSFDIAEGLVFKGSSKEIKELLDILLDNAMKYSKEKGGVHLDIKKDKPLVITVSNDIDPESDALLTEKMFDRFYRGDTSHNADENEGYGIGLAIAKAITKKYSGGIKAEIKDGKMIITAVLKSAK